MCLIQINNLYVVCFFSNLYYFYGPYLICINKSKPFLILFYLEQLSADGFGKKECRDIYIYLGPKAS